MIKSSKIYNLLRYIAIFLNLVYVLWILYNGIDEGFRGNIVAIIAPLGLVLLLIINVILLRHKITK